MKKKYGEDSELDSFKNRNWVLILQFKDLRIGQRKEPCIEVIQKNSIEFLVQYIYLYILTSNGLCSTTSSLL